MNDSRTSIDGTASTPASKGSRLSRRLRRVLATGAAVLAVGATSAGILATGTQAAHADPYWVTLNAGNSGLALDVSGAATWPSAPVIQWYDNGGANQHWHVPGSSDYGEIINQNSGLCLTTDGNAGDQLYQDTCTGSPGQLWWSSNLFDDTWAFTTNPYSGLSIDVYGNSQWAGASIDGWYGNGQLNQWFTAIGA
jgi:Ricin-type beta-trefoil lectin domain-like